MGYRSDVAIAIYKKDLQRMIEESKKIKDDDSIFYWIMSGNERNLECADNDKVAVLYWESIKWYEEYKEVEFIMNFIKSLDEYEFVRIGEDFEDYETERKHKEDEWYCIAPEARIYMSVTNNESPMQ